VFGSVGLLESAGALDLSDTARTAAQAMQDAQAGRIGQSREEFSHALQLTLVGFTHGKSSFFELLPKSNIGGK
jgi:hypothetical protein